MLRRALKIEMKIGQKVEIELKMCFPIILKAQLVAGIIMQNNIHV